jgi:signal transduction histidine kinase
VKFNRERPGRAVRKAPPTGLRLRETRNDAGEPRNDNVTRTYGIRRRSQAVPGRPEQSASPDQRALLWSIAHELRAPLTALTTVAEVLAEDATGLDPAEVSRLARTVQGVAHWLQATTDSLLTTAAIEARHLRIARAPTHLEDVVDEICPVLEPLLAARDQQLRLRYGRGPHLVLADRQRIGQVIINLVSNASKYGPASAPIDVTLEGRNGRVRVVVADRGPGIAPEVQRRIFAPFFRDERAWESGVTGSGLGLAIAKAVVAAHFGQVGVRNRVGGGARFWFELPALGEAPLPFPSQDEAGRLKTG